jgi:hypothetical protein
MNAPRFAKAQFEAIDGYSELIRTYGRDDEDFYDRLIAAGYARREIPPELPEPDHVSYAIAGQAERPSGRCPTARLTGGRR